MDSKGRWWVVIALLLRAATCTEIAISENAITEKGAADVASLNDGQMMVAVWTSNGQDGDSGGIYGRITTMMGVPLTSEFLIPQTTAGDQKTPRVAALTGGNFAVSWKSTNHAYVRLFNILGDPLTPEIHVNRRLGMADHPYIFPFRSGGGFGIVYDAESGVLVHIYDHTGSEIRSFSGEGGCYFPTATALDDGSFAVLCTAFFDLRLTYYNSLGFEIEPTQIFGTSPNFLEYGHICTRDDGQLAYAYYDWDDWAGAGVVKYGTVTSTRVISTPVDKPIFSDDYNPMMLCTDTHSLVYFYGNTLAWWEAGGNTQQVVDNEFGSWDLLGATRLKSDLGSYAIAYPSTDNIVYLKFIDPVSAVTSNAPDTLAPATGVPTAPEPTSFVIGTVTYGRQESPSVAALNDGTTVVVWQTEGVDSTGFAIMGQLFDSSFTASGSPFQINTLTHSDQVHPHVSRTTSGYVVVWQTVLHTEVKVYAREWNGAAWESEIHVNDGFSMKFDTMPVVAGELSGYVVSWQSYGRDGSYSGIYARRLGGSNVATWLVNTETTSAQQRPAISKLATGFVITWESLDQQVGGTRFSIYSQVYDDNCIPVGVEAAVTSELGYSQIQSSITSIPGGGYYVAWTSNGGRDGAGNGIFAQEFDASGTKVGAEFQINSAITGTQRRASIAILPSGDLVAAYESDIRDGTDFNVIYREIQRSGGVTISAGEEVEMNSFKPFKQFNAAIVAQSWGVVVAFTSDKQDTSKTGVYCIKKEYSFPSIPYTLEATATDDQIESDAVLLSDGSFAIVYTTTDLDRSTQSVCFQIHSGFGAVSSEVVVAADSRFGRITSSGDGYFYVGYDDVANHYFRLSKYDNKGNPIWTGQIADNAGVDREVRSAIVASSSEVFVAIKSNTVSYIQMDSLGVPIIPSAVIVADGLTTADRPSIGLLSSGEQIIVYHVDSKDGDGYGVYGAVYQPGGTQQSLNHISTDHVAGDQLDPDVIGLSDGGYAVTYVSNGQVIIKKYDSSHVVVTIGGQTSTVVTADGQFGSKPRLTETDSIITIVWYSVDNSDVGIIGQRINDEGLYGSQFQISGGASIDTNPTIVTRSDHRLYSTFIRYDEATLRYRVAAVSYDGSNP
eukprot:TRINITY_DN1726_c0_g1_i1.p1 TRINITY_DN1726_c0_g1~~TRINITY_DN1726_c0_g1_i1.p1  ORF type:complete len:1117 (+),score=250.13 TRINITY_DN1726_c0_g1_i1:52-3402(+)